MTPWLALPRSWIASLGEISRFGARTVGLVYSGRVLRFVGEALRQAGILILTSALVIWGPERSARSSTRCRSSASTRSKTWSCPAFWP